MTFRRIDIPTALDGTGAGVGQLMNNISTKLWIVEQISVITSPTVSGCTCKLTPPTGIIDTSYFAGTGDVAGGDPPIYLEPGDYINMTWANGPANGQGVATCYLNEVDLATAT